MNLGNFNGIWARYSRFALFGFWGYVLWQAYLLVIPERPAYTPIQSTMAHELATQATDWLQSIELTSGTLFLGNFHRDDFGLISHPVRHSIQQSDLVLLKPRTLEERFREKIGWSLPTWYPHQELLKSAKLRHADYALGGTVERNRDQGGQGELICHLVLWNAQTYSSVAEKRISVTHQTSLLNQLIEPATTGWMANWPHRFMFWLGITLMAPVLLIPVADKILVKGSNTVILLTLITLIIGSTAGAIAWILPKSPAGVWQTMLLLFIVGMTGVYHYNALKFIKSRSI